MLGDSHNISMFEMRRRAQIHVIASKWQVSSRGSSQNNVHEGLSGDSQSQAITLEVHITADEFGSYVDTIHRSEFTPKFEIPEGRPGDGFPYFRKVFTLWELSSCFRNPVLLELAIDAIRDWWFKLRLVGRWIETEHSIFSTLLNGARGTTHHFQSIFCGLARVRLLGSSSNTTMISTRNSCRWSCIGSWPVWKPTIRIDRLY